MLQLKHAHAFLRVCIGLWISLIAISSHAQTLEFNADQWQLVSFSRLPADKTIENVFGSSVNEDIASIWTFDNNLKTWQSWPTQHNVPSSDLTELEVGKGYWVKAIKNLVLDLSDATESAGEMILYPGWNLIGFTMEQSLTHEQALSGVSYIELWKFDANTQAFQVVQKSSGSRIILKEQFTQIEPNQGYWVKIEEQAELNPSMGTLLPPDIDIEPLVNITKYGEETTWGTLSPGDVDWDGDGNYDFPNTQDVVAFGDFLNKQHISITNEGNGVLSWLARVQGGDSEWLLFETTDENGNTTYSNQIMGSASNGNSAVTLFADRIGRAPGRTYQAELVTDVTQQPKLFVAQHKPHVMH